MGSRPALVWRFEVPYADIGALTWFASQWTREIVHSVLAVSHAANPDGLLDSNIAGFVWVTDVDVAPVPSTDR